MIVPCKDLLKTLFNLYRKDPKIMSDYHVLAPSNLEACVMKTYKDLNQAHIKVYDIVDKQANNRTIGYFGHETINQDHFLTGFMLDKEKRSKEVSSMFFNTIKDFIPKPFKIGIFDKNTRAAKFLLAHNAKVHTKLNNATFYVVEGE